MPAPMSPRARDEGRRRESPAWTRYGRARHAHPRPCQPAFAARSRDLRRLGHRRERCGESDEIAIGDALLSIGKRLEPFEDANETSLVDRHAKLLEPSANGAPTAVLAEDERAALLPDRMRRHDLIRLTILEHAVLMDPRLVRKRVGADDCFVQGHMDASAFGDEP